MHDSCTPFATDINKAAVPQSAPGQTEYGSPSNPQPKQNAPTAAGISFLLRPQLQP